MKKRFNIVDVIIIVLVIAAIAAGCFFYMNLKNKDNQASVQSNTSKIHFVIEVNNLTEETAKSYKSVEGSTVSFGETSTGSGSIFNVEIVPYKRWIRNTVDGVYVLTEVPEKYTAKVTIESEVSKTDTAFTSGSEVICVGKKMPFNSFSVASEESYIVNLIEVE